MSEAFDIYNLFFLALAVVIFLRLRSVLGRRTGNERKPYDPYTARDRAETGSSKRDDDKVIPLPGGQDNKSRQSRAEPKVPSWEEYAPKGSSMNKAFTKIFQADNSFDPGRFLEGARIAYEMIVTAFAQGDRRTLGNLLGDDVYEGFESAIEEREKAGQTMQSNFVGIEKADIIDASVKGPNANITVKFISELVSATFDADGKLVEGDPKKVREVTDVWTFMRDITSRDPNWKLIATEAAH